MCDLVAILHILSAKMRVNEWDEGLPTRERPGGEGGERKACGRRQCGGREEWNIG
ncbi:hypothetical protein X946_3779 [Burkholderia sp. ABCPW 111]|nr:hypothetical protein X946_3779 [Burkholderia sp. ABCPW 111]